MTIPGEEEDDGDVVDIVEEDGRRWQGGGGRSAHRRRLSRARAEARSVHGGQGDGEARLGLPAGGEGRRGGGSVEGRPYGTGGNFIGVYGASPAVKSTRLSTWTCWMRAVQEVDDASVRVGWMGCWAAPGCGALLGCR